MTIPYGRQDVTQVDIEAVASVLRSDFLTQGPMVPRFEAEVLKRCGVRHALAMNSATSALHVACLALGVGEGDRLWTTPNTFVASANCGLYCGAEVDFVDINPLSYSLSADALERKLVAAAREGRLPKVVVPVDFSGQPADLRAIHALSQKYGFRIIEDASHAIGARYGNEPVGNCRYSDITIFSFHPVKLVTTGEGGMALTNDSELAARMARLRTHGITREPAEMAWDSEGPWYYQQVDLGFNYRMTDIQAALGISQLQRLEQYIERRQVLARRYDSRLKDLPLTLPWRDPECISALHLYVVRLRDGTRRRRVFEGMRRRGIGVNVHYIPVHLQPYYRRLGFKPGDFPEAERYYAEAMTLPLFPTLSEAQQDEVVSALEESLAA